jgi:hypothetical protein
LKKVSQNPTLNLFRRKTRAKVGFCGTFTKVRFCDTFSKSIYIERIMPPLILSQTVGPASIPLAQHHPNNQTTAAMGMPFKPSTMTQGSFFAMARAAYNRDVNTNVNSIGDLPTPPGKKKWYGASASRTCGEHINLKGIEATGKSSTNQLKPSQLMSFSGPDQTSVKNALVRCRANGCVAPKKIGANKI